MEKIGGARGNRLSRGYLAVSPRGYLFVHLRGYLFAHLGDTLGTPEQ